MVRRTERAIGVTQVRWLGIARRHQLGRLSPLLVT